MTEEKNIIYWKTFDEPKHVVQKIGDKVHEFDVTGKWECDHESVERIMVLGGSPKIENGPITLMVDILFKDGGRKTFEDNDPKDYSVVKKASDYLKKGGIGDSYPMNFEDIKPV